MKVSSDRKLFRRQWTARPERPNERRLRQAGEGGWSEIRAMDPLIHRDPPRRSPGAARDRFRSHFAERESPIRVHVARTPRRGRGGRRFIYARDYFWRKWV